MPNVYFFFSWSATTEFPNHCVSTQVLSMMEDLSMEHKNGRHMTNPMLTNSTSSQRVLTAGGKNRWQTDVDQVLITCLLFQDTVVSHLTVSLSVTFTRLALGQGSPACTSAFVTKDGRVLAIKQRWGHSTKLNNGSHIGQLAVARFPLAHLKKKKCCLWIVLAHAYWRGSEGLIPYSKEGKVWSWPITCM
jgi:hypothetical protein